MWLWPVEITWRRWLRQNVQPPDSHLELHFVRHVWNFDLTWFLSFPRNYTNNIRILVSENSSANFLAGHRKFAVDLVPLSVIKLYRQQQSARRVLISLYAVNNNNWLHIGIHKRITGKEEDGGFSDYMFVSSVCLAVSTARATNPCRYSPTSTTDHRVVSCLGLNGRLRSYTA